MNRKLTPRETKLVIAVFLLALIALLYLFWFRPQWDKLLSLRGEVANLQQSIANRASSTHASSSPSPNTVAPQSGTGAKSITLPSDADESGLLATFAKVAAETGVRVVSIAAASAANSTDESTTTTNASSANQTGTTGGGQVLPNISLQLAVQGSSAQVEAFLEGLHDAPRLLDVTTVNLQPQNGHTQADINLLAYYAPSN
ncbi:MULTISPECIES: hypothetical protein [Alicyclobacillus]|uniref:Uncharacterized protein n=1 Tax=Alicyclobacillus acidoterrestris (strain ATCC 49025 / DSM 3922 / CIP 106132 / NCIMB 13137 / GD3B) TaxID=1356854 RepID=T0BUM8_ALIAG|nr:MULTISPECIES: hypothetical protein [Alicyclobacillus]EPZ44135.1 hypothetical protein N007_11470 [Alicyclobacillus acidoterrestris ATCC 49025]UNO49654.1 hypothetical protein K1I37_03700 [Alicyclobacillus acidoterrestris]